MEGCRETTDSSTRKSPFFNGSIAEAIGVAQSQKKSLVIYIAEENEDCQKMDQTTWQDCKVQKALLEQFVTLRLWHRSADAAHFAAMFPYSTVPCISLINHNGMLLKQLGGYVAPAELLSTLEQLIAMQNTAAIVAALASANNDSTALLKESETNRASNEPECVESDMVGSSDMKNDSDVPAPAATSVTPLDADSSLPEDLASAPIHAPVAGGSSTKVPEDISHIPVQTVATQSKISENRRSPEIESATRDVLPDAVSLSQDNVASRALETRPKNPLASIDASPEPLEQKVSHPQITEAVSKTKKSAEIFRIQVRLTNGKSIRKSFNPKDCLAAVKEFVDETRDDGNAPYSIGMLYPRKVFGENDMGKTLLELSLDDRASLILVTNQMKQTFPSPETISTRAASSDVTSSDTNGGFWKILSYLNPLSYFSGSSSNTNTSESRPSSWQYEPDPSLRSSFRQGAESPGSLRPDVDGASTSNVKGISKERKWGGNVHTLQHNDNDEAFKRGNAFWNGNSTQYGGDDSKK